MTSSDEEQRTAEEQPEREGAQQVADSVADAEQSAAGDAGRVTAQRNRRSGKATRRWRVRALWIALVLVFIVPSAIVGVGYLTAPVPRILVIETGESAVIYADDGSAVVPVRGNQRDVPINKLIKTQVLQELRALGMSEEQLNAGGLRITTTIDPKAQAAAVDAVGKNMLGEPDNLRSAVVSVDPRSGAVRAYVGGPNDHGFDYADAGVLPGSTFEVFGLAENLAQGKPLSTAYDSSPVTVHGIEIDNVAGESCGTCTIAEALKRSLDTSFFRMQLDMGPNGPQQIADMAHTLGIPKTIPGVGKSLAEPDGSGPNGGIVLGQYPVRPRDMASAYATLAASGEYHAPHFVQKVMTDDGDVLLDRGFIAGETRVAGAVADNVTDAMRPIADWSRNHGLADGRASAAKTGTTRLGSTGENKDAWMIGYTPSLSTAVWVGTDQGHPLRDANGAMIFGSGLPAGIWKDTMDGALRGSPKEEFRTPAKIGN